MSNGLPPELFAERPVSSGHAAGGPSYAARRMITICLLTALIGGGLYWKFGSRAPDRPAEIPVVKAEGPYKQRPEQPGGLDIPHQDVQVYQELDKKSAPLPVEHLLPPPETPDAAAATPPAPPQRQGAPAAIVESVIPPKQVNAGDDILGEKTPPALVPTTVTPPAPLALSPAQAPAAVPIAPPQARPVSPAAAPPPAAVKETADQKTLDQIIRNIGSGDARAVVPAAARNPGGDYAVQLASSPDQAAAQREMERLQKNYAAALGSAQLHLVKADLGAKGVYYRIQSQPLAGDRAHALCAALKSLNAGCIIARL